MSTFKVKHGQRYRAHIKFGLFDPHQFANDQQIKEHLESLGLEHVDVVGEGRERWAFATWPGPNESVELPGDITEVEPML